jgi:glycosyltransferase involved in cell wall biosynthesis
VLSARRHVDLVLVIDDGSSDETAELAEVAGAVVIRHERNGGKGAAVNTAFREARRRGALALVLLDGDGQHRTADIAPVLRPVLDGEADVTVGSRFLAIKSDIPAYRQFGQHALTAATNLSSGVRLTDSQSGFRAFSRTAIEALTFRGSGFSVESEMQFLIREYGLRPAEVPIGVVYEEPAKRNPVGHGMAVLHGIVRLVSQGRPLFFFGTPGLLLLVLGILLGAHIVRVYEQTQILAVGYAMLTVLLTIVGVLAIFVGLMLNAVRAILIEVRRPTNEA